MKAYDFKRDNLGNNKYRSYKQGAKQEEAKADIGEKEKQSHARQSKRDCRFCDNVVHLQLEILEEP